jgi:alkylation response protein AidB-like acyl-CoA dehydrogenase
MDFELDDDQLQLQAAARAVLARECPPTIVRAAVEGGEDGSGLWATMVELGWPAMAVPESDGGMGATAVELAIVLEEGGYAAEPTPLLATTTQFTPLVRALGDADQCRELLGGIAAGRTGAVAADGVEAEPEGGRWRLAGCAPWVVDGDRADEIVVLTASEAFVVPGTEATATRIATFDRSVHVASVRFDGVVVPAERRLAWSDEAVDAARQEAVAGLAAAMVGTCQRIVDLTVEYVKQRHQFGVPIGSFQAVKHKAVDMFVAVQRARVLAQFAALTIAAGDPRQAVAASMAKAAAGDCQQVVFQHGLQLFGGLGYTWENDLQLFLKRAKTGELLLGGASAHRARVAEAVLPAS